MNQPNPLSVLLREVLPIFGPISLGRLSHNKRIRPTKIMQLAAKHVDPARLAVVSSKKRHTHKENIADVKRRFSTKARFLN